MKKNAGRFAGICMLMLLCFAFCTGAAGEGTAEEKPEHGIPLVIIRIDESGEAIAKAAQGDPAHEYGTVDEMNGSMEHSVWCVGEIQIIVPDGFAGEYGSAEVPAEPVALRYIRGRGHMSWGMSDKKSYKIKLQDKQAFFGMGKSNDWALMANSMDSSLLRNRITYKLGELTGLAWSPRQIPVDVVMIGSVSGRRELGSYTLCETVRVEKGRVALPKLKEDTVSEKPADDPNITGGYLLSIYSKTQDGVRPESAMIRTKAGTEWQIEEPEYESDDLTEGQRKQSDYIRSFVQETEDLIMSPGEISPETHEAIDARMDLESAAVYWWVQTFSGNSDAYTNSSTYMYKTPDTESGKGKLYWGPLWDFDLGYTDDGESLTTMKTGLNNASLIWLDELRDRDPLFIELLKECWQDPENGIDAALAEITREGGVLDRYRDEIRASWAADYLLWGWAEEEDADPGAGLDEELEFIRARIDGRRAWINDHLDELDQVYFNITYMAGDEVYATGRVHGDRNIVNPPEAPEREGYLFAGWKEQESGESLVGLMIRKDLTFTAEYLDKNEITAPEAVFLANTEEWADLTDGSAWYLMTVLPEDAVTGTAVWDSSDPDVAMTDGNRIILTGTGDTTLMVTLWNGTAASCLLHVYNPEQISPAAPQGAAFASPSVTVRAGEIKQLDVFALPKDCPVSYNGYQFSFVPADSDIISVSYGMARPVLITGLKPGRTMLTATLANLWDDNAPVFTAECEIIVSEE